MRTPKIRKLECWCREIEQLVEEAGQESLFLSESEMTVCQYTCRKHPIWLSESRAAGYLSTGKVCEQRGPGSVLEFGRRPCRDVLAEVDKHLELSLW